jgi:hypothetical protein
MSLSLFYLLFKNRERTIPVSITSVKMAYTVEKFTAVIRIYIYLARLYSSWLYILTTSTLFLFILVDTPDEDLLNKTNDPVIATLVQLSLVVPTCLFILFTGYGIYYWMRIAGKTPNLMLHEKILGYLSLDILINSLWTNLIIYLFGLGDSQSFIVSFLVFWCIHTITTAISLVLIGKRVYTRCVRCSRRSTCDTEEEQISLLTMPTIPDMTEKQKQIHYQS